MRFPSGVTDQSKRIPTGIAIKYSDDPKGYRRAYYSQNRERLLSASRERGAEWRRINGEYKRNRAREICATRKTQAFALFGSVCGRCGYSDARALQIDHIAQFQGGRTARVKAGESGEKLYARLIGGKADKSKYQLLCANCNWIKREENSECKRKRGMQ